MVLIRYGADSCPQFLTPKSRRAGLKFGEIIAEYMRNSGGVEKAKVRFLSTVLIFLVRLLIFYAFLDKIEDG